MNFIGEEQKFKELMNMWFKEQSKLSRHNANQKTIHAYTHNTHIRMSNNQEQ